MFRVEPGRLCTEPGDQSARLVSVLFDLCVFRASRVVFTEWSGAMNVLVILLLVILLLGGGGGYYAGRPYIGGGALGLLVLVVLILLLTGNLRLR
jgi:hypothetical protein